METQKRGLSTILLLAGRFDEPENNLKTLAIDLEIGNSLRFLGPVDDVWGLLQAVDLYVHSSKTEGTPNAVLEAMASGLTVVGNDIPGIREVLRPENNKRYLVPSESPELLANTVIELAFDNRMRHEIGVANRSYVMSNFSLDKMCQETTNYIINCLER
jgi:glycosyltransferase involved in cell wall biosynthesis